MSSSHETTEKEARAPVEQALAETVTEQRGEDGEARRMACTRQAWTAQDRGSQPRVKHDAATRTPAHRGQRVSLSNEMIMNEEYEVEGAKEARSIASSSVTNTATSVAVRLMRCRRRSVSGCSTGSSLWGGRGLGAGLGLGALLRSPLG